MDLEESKSDFITITGKCDFKLFDEINQKFVELYKINPENINLFLDGIYNTILFKDVMQRKQKYRQESNWYLNLK